MPTLQSIVSGSGAEVEGKFPLYTNFAFTECGSKANTANKSPCRPVACRVVLVSSRALCGIDC
jgi:hypothetical protein